MKLGERTGKNQECPICHKSFYVKPSHSVFRKYCSYKCKGINKSTKPGFFTGNIHSIKTKRVLNTSDLPDKPDPGTPPSEESILPALQNDEEQPSREAAEIEELAPNSQICQRTYQ